MQTLIKVFGERVLENVLAVEVFRPQQVIYLCPAEGISLREQSRIYKNFFSQRGWKPRLSFSPCSLYNADAITYSLEHLYKALTDAAKEEGRDADCVLDVTGGTEAMLVAVGCFAYRHNIPVFTYSRRANRFYSIHGAHSAEEKKWDIRYSVEEFFLMAGGHMRPGRVDNAILSRYMPLFDPFFEVYMRHSRVWPDAVLWFQDVSPDPEAMDIEASRTVKGAHGKKIRIPEELLQDLASSGLISEPLWEEDTVRFTFRDSHIRTWLRDTGSVLELYVYKACVNAGIFNDVVSSAVVDWDEQTGKSMVSNEIDAVAARGTVPLFISCKTCPVKTEALNELAVLRDRFGGKGAKACIITAETANAAARHRAAQLQIAVIDPEELDSESLIHRLKVIMKAE